MHSLIKQIGTGACTIYVEAMVSAVTDHTICDPPTTCSILVCSTAIIIIIYTDTSQYLLYCNLDYFIFDQLSGLFWLVMMAAWFKA
jgi:hypothetical protein